MIVTMAAAKTTKTSVFSVSLWQVFEYLLTRIREEPQVITQ